MTTDRYRLMCISDLDQLRALVSSEETDSGFLEDIEVVSEARRSLEAVHLIQLGARATLVAQLTGIGKKTVTDLYPR